MDEASGSVRQSPAPKAQRWLGLGSPILGALILLGVGADLVRIEFPAQSGWRTAATVGALLMLVLGYAVIPRLSERRWLVAVISIFNSLATVYLGYLAVNTSIYQFYFVDYPPSLSATGADFVRQSWDFIGTGMIVWGSFNLAITAWICFWWQRRLWAA